MSGKRKKPLYKRFFSRRVKSGGSHKVLAAMTAVLGLIMMSFGFVSAPALATGGGGSNDNFKVFVCKYVGTPGDDERLQTGQNPISVSVNSIPDYQGVGSYFADQHGRSFVLAVDDTPPGPAGDPDVSACPPPDNPPDVIQIPATPSSEDPCGPNNATWNVPADTDTLNWELLPNGHLVVTIVAEDTTFPGGATSHDFGTVTDSGTPCPPNVIDVPATPSSEDPCGPNNATWNVPADTGVLNWTLLDNGHLTVTIIPENTTFPGGATSHDYGKAPDSGEKCPPTKIDIPAAPSVTDPCGPNNATWNVPADTDTLNWELLENGHLTVTIIPEDTVFTDGTTSHDYGVATDSGEACPPTPVSPTAPEQVDACEPAKGGTFDSYTIPSDANFTYEANDAEAKPGTHPADLTEYVIVAVPNQGVVVKEGAQTEWTFTFSKAVCLIPPEVLAPDGSISVDCKGKGVAVADNSESTTSFGFEVVVNDQATLYSLDAGEVREIKFSGAEPGSVVILQDGEANELDSARVPLKCGGDNPPPDDDNPPDNPTFDTGLSGQLPEQGVGGVPVGLIGLLFVGLAVGIMLIGSPTLARARRR